MNKKIDVDFGLIINIILIEFAKLLNINPIDIKRKNKKRDVTEIRNLFYKLCYETFELSFTVIANEMDRSVSTVTRGLRHVNDLFDLKDPTIELIWNMVKDIPYPEDVLQQGLATARAVHQPNATIAETKKQFSNNLNLNKSYEGNYRRTTC